MRLWLTFLPLLGLATVAVGQDAGPAAAAGYTLGSSITAPRAIYYPGPKYPNVPRKKRLEGTVLLWIVIGSDGKVQDIRVTRSLAKQFDEEAVKAVSTWKFEPAKKDGRPVTVQMNVEVNFKHH